MNDNSSFLWTKHITPTPGGYMQVKCVEWSILIVYSPLLIRKVKVKMQCLQRDQHYPWPFWLRKVRTWLYLGVDISSQGRMTHYRHNKGPCPWVEWLDISLQGRMVHYRHNKGPHPCCCYEVNSGFWEQGALSLLWQLQQPWPIHCMTFGNLGLGHVA